VVVKDVLEERLYTFDEPVTGNALEATVSRLRKRLASAGAVVQVETKRGIGYRLVPGEDAQVVSTDSQVIHFSKRVLLRQPHQRMGSSLCVADRRVRAGGLGPDQGPRARAAAALELEG
jgi:hypothetical protein